ncbi:telomere repeats-binding bouquet formation protein 2 [Ranitomeya variabilis]|uniref:telomere repeats-binding bouquet formation protein 2 n=1 Tax=Ranitomeya variabilis TaxID=490064 RepID=UPI0040564E80
MYAGHRGWFSQSVERDLVHIWESEGGAIANKSHQADYLFSSDASHRDTQRIYNSLEYIENKATVFHASFLRLHTQLETKTMVTLGNFILPPPSIHKEIKMKIGNFIWEQDKSSHIQQCTDLEDEPLNPEYKQRSSADLEKSEALQLHTLHKYPENNMFSEGGFWLWWSYIAAREHPVQTEKSYTSIDQLKKFSGELHDFIPDASEYCVLYVHGDCSDFPSIKTVHNKK